MKHYLCILKRKDMEKLTIKLTDQEIEYLTNFTKKGKRNSREFERAYILLAADKGVSNQLISELFHVSNATIWRLKKKYEEGGVDFALKDLQRPGQPIKYADKQDATITAIACSDAPEGRVRWTLELITEEAQKYTDLKGISRETVRLILKKRKLSLG